MTTRRSVRRAGLGLFAVIFGSGALLLAVRASDSATSVEKAGTLLGPLDLQSYCRRHYGQRAQAVATRIDAYGWQCTYGVNGFLHIQDIDLDQACSSMYSGIAYSVTYDGSVQASWQCLRGPKP
jgi:hypothetical protein